MKPQNVTAVFAAGAFRIFDQGHVLSLPVAMNQNVEKMAGAAGLEPVTSAVTGQRSNQLSYAPAWGRRTYGNVRLASS